MKKNDFEILPYHSLNTLIQLVLKRFFKVQPVYAITTETIPLTGLGQQLNGLHGAPYNIAVNSTTV